MIFHCIILNYMILSSITLSFTFSKLPDTSFYNIYSIKYVILFCDIINIVFCYIYLHDLLLNDSKLHGTQLYYIKSYSMISIPCHIVLYDIVVYCINLPCIWWYYLTLNDVIFSSLILCFWKFNVSNKICQYLI